MWFMYLLLAILAGVMVWGIISPQSLWRVLEARQYKNPEANEPSEAGYALRRVAYVIGLVAVLFFMMLLPSYAKNIDSDQVPEEQQYEDCLDDWGDDTLLPAEDYCEDVAPADYP